MIITDDNIAIISLEDVINKEILSIDHPLSLVCITYNCSDSMKVSEIIRFCTNNFNKLKYDFLCACSHTINTCNLAFLNRHLIWTDRIKGFHIALLPFDKLIEVLNNEVNGIDDFIKYVNRFFINKFFFLHNDINNNCIKSQKLINYVTENIL